MKSIKLIKPVILSLLITGMTISVYASSQVESFTDMTEEHWAFASVTEMSKTGIISGYPDGSFKPEAIVTYAEFIKMAAVADDTVKDGVKAKSGEHWGKPYYDVGMNNMYFTEWDIPRSSLDQPIPRKHMALIASGVMGEEVKVSDYGDYSKIQESIYDVDHRTDYEYDIIKAYATGVLSGYPDGCFRPDACLTRAEAATVIDRLTKVMGIEQDVSEQVPETEETVKSWVEVDKDLLGYPKGSYAIIVRDYGVNRKAQHAEMLAKLKEKYPNEAEDIVKVAIEFGSKPTGKNNMGLRKQYFGNYPVLMNHIGNDLYVSVLPIGYDSLTWETKPGQINEYFF
ncbi:MAG: S-layer homology domain-containing protein [Eubacteriales bacterium]|nr:S-layer homology domain-containing protein [Eubacteriales bacterium]